MALADVLRDDGHRVEAFDAPSSVPPLESLGHVAVLVTDYQLPESNGLEFADAFHTAYPNVPIILVTADPCSHLDGAAGSRPYVQLHRKPIDYRTLNASIRKGLAHDRIR
jgi:DNA-binding NtrC family response regulator